MLIIEQASQSLDAIGHILGVDTDVAERDERLADRHQQPPLVDERLLELGARDAPDLHENLAGPRRSQLQGGDLERLRLGVRSRRSDGIEDCRADFHSWSRDEPAVWIDAIIGVS